jgi:hypothetical protein
MSNVPAPMWPATNTPVHPGEQAPKPIPKEIELRLFAAKLPLDRDGLLALWDTTKKTLEAAKADEMALRKLCVDTLIAQPVEGTNNVELANGYVAKAVCNYSYNVIKPEGERDKISAVDKCIDAFRRLSNEGAFIAERLFKFSVDVSITEYRKLAEDAKTSAVAASLLRELNKVLEIKPKAPTLEIKAPKK